MNKNRIITSAITVIIFITGSVIKANAQNIEKKDGPGSYEILKKNEDPIRIPFRMHNGKPLLDLEINGQKATLMIDNGVLWDETWLFGSQLVEDLQLKPVEEVTIGGAGEGDPTAAYLSSNLSLKFKDIIFYEQPSFVSPSAAGFAKMFPGADGQLCNTIFKHFIVEFDFINNEVILHDPTQFKYMGNGSILDLTLCESGAYAIPFSFAMNNGRVYTDNVDIDFGGVYELQIALGGEHNIQLPDNIDEATSYGVQGRVPGYKGEIQSMTIGKYRFDDPTVYFGDEKTSRIHPGNLGVVGLPLFMKFKIVFDYFNYKLYLEPNSNFDGTFEQMTK